MLFILIFTHAEAKADNQRMDQGLDDRDWTDFFYQGISTPPSLLAVQWIIKDEKSGQLLHHFTGSESIFLFSFLSLSFVRCRCCCRMQFRPIQPIQLALSALEIGHFISFTSPLRCLLFFPIIYIMRWPMKLALVCAFRDSSNQRQHNSSEVALLWDAAIEKKRRNPFEKWPERRMCCWFKYGAGSYFLVLVSWWRLRWVMYCVGKHCGRRWTRYRCVSLTKHGN